MSAVINLRDAAPAEFDAWAQGVIDAALKTPYFHLDGYMERYWVQKPAPTKDDEYSNASRVHKFLRSDTDRALHCHPWASTSIVLFYGYHEMLPLSQDQPPSKDPANHVVIWRRPGDIVHRAARDRHRIILEPGCDAWSLFIVEDREKPWFFHDPVRGQVPWREYLDEASANEHDQYWKKGSMT